MITNILQNGSTVATINSAGMDVFNSFEVIKDGTVMMGASADGIVLNRPLIFNTMQMSKVPTNKTTPATWANVKINIKRKTWKFLHFVVKCVRVIKSYKFQLQR